MNGAIRHIVIVGGGSAGWLTAGLLASTHRHASDDPADALRITLIESPDVPTIGVGEGTWPSMRDTLRRIGVRETDVVRECDAVFKQGSKFARWVHDEDGDAYHHPFSLPQDFLDADLVSGWMAREGRAAYAALASVQPHLCEAGRAPKQFSTPEFAGVANYAYHLDAAKLGAFLRRHCVDTLGVRHVADHMVEVVSREDGDIAAVRTREHGDIAGDLFIDCTGLRALLIGGHFGVGMVDCREVLFNDRALAVQVPYADAAAPIACHTISTAQRHGWTWDIGLSARRGVGYVHSSAHASDAEAEAVLRAQGEAQAILAVAAAQAQALREVGEAANTPDGQKAIQLDLASKAIAAKQAIAKESTVVLLPDSSTDAASLVTQAMTIINKLNKLPEGTDNAMGDK